MTATAKLAEHQRELREKLQADGLQKYSEDGGGAGGKEGKGWKKFQSYKGEGALPPEVDKLRVGSRASSIAVFLYLSLTLVERSWLTARHRQLSYQCMGLQYLSISTL
jgi:nucleosome binding factor SPN SPT16 subunit